MTCRCASWWPIRNRRFNAPLCSIHKCLLTSWWTWPGPGSLNWPAWPGNIPTSLPLKRPTCVGWRRCAVTRTVSFSSWRRSFVVPTSRVPPRKVRRWKLRPSVSMPVCAHNWTKSIRNGSGPARRRRAAAGTGGPELSQASIQDRQRHAEEGLRPWRLEAAAVEAQARQDAQRHHDQALRQLIEDARLAEHQVRDPWIAVRLERDAEHDTALRQLAHDAQIQHEQVLEQLKGQLAAAERPQALHTRQLELTRTFQQQLAEVQARLDEQLQRAQQALVDAHQSALMANRDHLQAQHDALLAQASEQALVQGRQRHENELQALL